MKNFYVYSFLSKLFSMRKLKQNTKAHSTFHVNISESNNKWNKAAVLLATEQDKLPTKRGSAICYPQIGRATTLPSKRIRTTNEWNTLALNIVALKCSGDN